MRSGRTAIVLVGKSMLLTSPLEVESDVPNLRLRHGEQRDGRDADCHEHERDADKEESQRDRSSGEFGYSTSRSHKQRVETINPHCDSMSARCGCAKSVGIPKGRLRRREALAKASAESQSDSSAFADRIAPRRSRTSLAWWSSVKT
jgi:hypothetical protein